MKNITIRICREPLIHFLLFGLGIFLAYGYFADDKSDSDVNRIVVDRGRLLTFLQYRTKAFDSNRFEEILDTLPEEKLQALINDYVREEALYREAKALSLDKNDYVARRRLIQQFEYIARGFISSEMELSDEELQSFFKENQKDYFVPSKITFTHVFFSSDRRSVEESETLAQKELLELNRKSIPFHQGLSHGDRFLYHANYVEKEADEIASHFGSEMQEQLFALEPNDAIWRGPIRSTYGYHLVMVTKRADGYTPDFSEVSLKVKQDALQARLESEVDRTVQAVVDNYEVELVDIKMNSGKKGEKEHEEVNKDAG